MSSNKRKAGTGKSRVLHTKFGNLNLARPQDRKKAQKHV